MSKIRPLAGSGVIPGTSLPTQFIFRTATGDILVSSGTGGSAATGALKHIVNDILLKSGAGAAARTQLAEALALEELEGAINLAAIQGIQAGQKIIVVTEYAEWELIFEWSSSQGVWKLFHALPKIL